MSETSPDCALHPIVRPALLYRQWAFVGCFALFLALFYMIDDQRLHRTAFYGLIAVGVFSCFTLSFWRAFFAQRLVWLVLAYMGYQAMSLGWAAQFSAEELGEVGRKSALVLGFVAMVAWLVAKPVFAARVWQAVVLVATCSAVMSVALFLTQDAESGALIAERMTGLGRGRNPIQSAALYGVAVLAAVPMMLNALMQRRGGALFWLFCWFALVVALILTESRGAILACASAHLLLLAGVIVQKRRSLKGSVAWRIAVLICFLSLPVVGWLLVLSAEVIDWEHWLERADSFRFEIWQQVWVLTRENILFGLGYRTPFEMTLSNGQIIAQPHSLYVSAFYYGGIIGVFALLVLLATAGLRLWQTAMAKSEKAKAGQKEQGAGALFALALWLNGCIFALVDFSILLMNVEVEWLLFWLPIGAAIGYQMHNTQANQQGSKGDGNADIA